MMEQALELGTFACPNLVPSTDEWRIVGCLCKYHMEHSCYVPFNLPG